MARAQSVAPPVTFSTLGARYHAPATILAERDEAFVARLRGAGAVLLGKTNVAQCLLYYESDNPAGIRLASCRLTGYGKESVVVPYRVDLPATSEAAHDCLIDLGALDIEVSPDGGIAAVMPDDISPDQVRRAVGILTISSAVGRDADSVWILRPRPVQVGGLRIVPADIEAEPGDIRLNDAEAFGTGLHPTTALCLEALAEIVEDASPDSVLDVGTGSGVLALAALTLGVPRAVGIDIDEEALRAAAENARLNRLASRLQLSRGGPDSLIGAWPLVLANVLAAPLIEMAPSLVQRVGRRGRLVLSGIPRSVDEDVHRAYRRLGMRRVEVKARAGWVALILQATW